MQNNPKPSFPKKIKFEISVRSIFIISLYICLIYILIALKDVLLGLFISILFVTGLHPVVSYLEKFKIPRPVAILSIYVGIVFVISLALATIVPPLVTQTNTLLESIPQGLIADNFNRFEISAQNLQLLSNQLGSVKPFLNVLTSTFSGLITVITFAVITFYMLIERKDLYKHIAAFSPDIESENRVENLVNKVEIQIGSWVRGQIALMFTVGIITFIGLSLLGISYALPLAILAGILEIVPNIGPTIAAIPALLIPVLIDKNPIMSVFVLALYIIVQQLENNILVPRIMRTAVGLHPLVTILAIISGLKLAGVLGAILAVPMFLVAKVVIVELAIPLWKQYK